MRKVLHDIKTSKGTVRVAHNADWEEYQVFIVGRPATKYHTDCRDDAMSTAEHMAKELEQNG